MEALEAAVASGARGDDHVRCLATWARAAYAARRAAAGGDPAALDAVRRKTLQKTDQLASRLGDAAAVVEGGACR